MVAQRTSKPQLTETPPAFTDYRDLLSGKKWDLIIADIPWSYASRVGPKVKNLVAYPLLDEYTGMMSAFYQALRDDRNVWCWTDYFNLPALLDAAKTVGFTFRGLCVVKRRDFGLGGFSRKNLYFLPAWSKGAGYYNKSVAAAMPEFLGEYRVKRSRKPQAVYDQLIAHSLPPGGVWIDPFPATHDEVYKGPNGTTVAQPKLFTEAA